MGLGKEKAKGKAKQKEKEDPASSGTDDEESTDCATPTRPQELGASLDNEAKSDSNLFGRLGKRKKKQKTEEEEYALELKRRAKLCCHMTPEDSMNKDDSCHFRSDKPLQNLWFYAETFHDLPKDIHESILRMKYDRATLASNFTTLLNVLSFADKHVPRRRFVTHTQFARMKKLKAEAPQSSITEDLLLPPEDAYKSVNFAEARAIVKWDDYLGHGGFGQVVKAKCKDKKDPMFGKKVAVKFVPHKTPGEKQKNLEEVSVMHLCEHPNIVKLHRVLEVHQEIWIVMELLKGGNLKQASSSKVDLFNETEIAFVAGSILQALKYLHSKQIVHRDLKNLNVMLTVDGEVKVVDFGLAVDLSAGPRVGMVGSPEFLAPEMIRGEFYSYPVDIWSFVICILELANQRSRSKGSVKNTMFTTAIRGLPEPKFSKPGFWSTKFKDFVDKAGAFDPNERLGAEELLKHKFIKNACTRKKMKEKLQVVWYLHQ